MSRNWLAEESSEGLLFRAMFLEQVANAQRGSEIRDLELADRFIQEYDKLKPVSPATAVGSLKMNGKTNQVWCGSFCVRVCTPCYRVGQEGVVFCVVLCCVVC